MIPSTSPHASSGFKMSLGKQIFIGAALGIIIGVSLPKMFEIGWITEDTKNNFLSFFVLLRDIFLNLIKMMIAPLIFGSLVQGIAGTGEMKKVGRIGAKALVYFEILTTLALAVGLLAVNIIQPGQGVQLKTDAAAVSHLPTNQPMNVIQTIEHIFPTSIIDSMARGDVLQIVCFSVLFALAVIAAGDAGKPILAWCDSLRQVMFAFAATIMTVAPLGVSAALAASVGSNGVDVLFSLAKLVLTLYIALACFVVIILGAVILIFRVPMRPFIRAMTEPFLLAFATANSEAALPMAFERMERFGVPRGIVGFVLPMGYSFNLDGTTLYLAIASVFISQASGSHFTIWNQLVMMSVLMLSSKGVAAVPRASIVVLIAAVQSFNLPLEGCALILGVDAFMDMARTSVNVLGNCLASVIVAKWEGEFDPEVAKRAFGAAQPSSAPAPATKAVTE